MRRVQIRSEQQGTAHQNQIQQLQTSFNEQIVAWECAMGKFRLQQEQQREREKTSYITTF